ncbi:EamA family transporter [Adlercreutzia sp. ZJ473]|uniref:EamA family transporter n=1 Tax=Adlercreutzia sp. ZJ473 TaxID=2722822 RepID=UPI001C12D5D6|nr:EamA family transporter [Adlercreutzia sp. ZJ473]
MGLSWLFLYEAYQTVGVAVSSLAYYCAPIMVLALSPVVFKERLTGRILLSFAVVLAGALALNWGSVEGAGSLWGFFCGWMSAVRRAGRVVGVGRGARRGEHGARLLSVFLLVRGA